MSGVYGPAHVTSAITGLAISLPALGFIIAALGMVPIQFSTGCLLLGYSARPPTM
jgi:hypothetical protein